MTNSDMAQSQGRAKIQIFSPFLWWVILSRSPGTSLEVPTGVTSNWLLCQPLPSRLFHSCPSCALFMTDNLTFGSSHLDSATVLPHEDPLPQRQSRRLLCYTTIFQHTVEKICDVIVVLEFVLFLNCRKPVRMFWRNQSTNFMFHHLFQKKEKHEVIWSWWSQNLKQ